MTTNDALLAANTVVPRNAAINADDPTAGQFVGLIVEYVGDEDSCLITTASNNSIASAIGDAGSEAADANFTVGSTPGTIDLTNTSADTMGEVVDFINGLAGYKARLVSLLRADDADTTGALVAVTSQQAKVKGGLKLATDTSVCKHVSFEVSVLNGTIVASNAVGDSGLEDDAHRLVENALVRVDATLTYSGADLFRIYEVSDKAKTATLLYQSTISSILAASTSPGTETFTPAFAGARGKRLLVRLSAATSIAVTNLSMYAQSKVFA